MTLLSARLTAVRHARDAGSALAISLVFLMVFGLWIGVVLQFAATGQRSTLAMRDEAGATYSGGGALDGAINAVRGNLSEGTQAAGASTCFTLPAGELDNASAVAVTCEPRAGSGAPLGGGAASQPDRAVIAVSTNPVQGVLVTSGTTTVRGGVAVNRLLWVAPGATLDSSGYPVEAGTCPPPGVSGTVKDSCSVGGGVTAPSFPGPDTSATPLQLALPGCAPVVTLQPGIYRSASALQAVLNCNGSTIWFSPGTYFLDFQDAGSHELQFAGGAPRNSALVGGTRTGTACDPTAPGVDLVFGGDSRLTVGSGSVDLCAAVPLGDDTQQHVAVRGLTSAVAVDATSTGVATSAVSVPGGTPWTNPGRVLADDGNTATTKIAGSGRPPATLRVTFPAALVPADATNIEVTVAVEQGIDATSVTTSTATLRPASGAPIGPRMLRDCSVSACTGGLQLDTTTAFTGLTAGQLNGGTRVDVVLTKPGAANADGEIDQVRFELSYTLPVRRTCTLASGSCVPGSVATNPLLAASGAFPSTSLQVRGTIYAPDSVVDLAVTLAPATVVDRGLVVRHLRLAMTPAAGFSGPLISVPDLGQRPRRVVLTARDGTGTRLARAHVTFADPAGTRNGSVVTVDEWSVE